MATVFLPAFLRRTSALAIVFACWLASARAGEAEQPKGPVRSLSVEPAKVLLGGGSRRQQILVTAVRSDGTPVDVTRDCKFVVRDPGVAEVTGAVVHARRDGVTELVVRLGSLEARVGVEAAGTGSFPPVHFANDIVPVLSKLGCNSAGCHGKASGQNGFRLSVFGSDPLADFEALAREGRGRRVMPASPEQSLLLTKPTGRSPHGGGRRLEAGSDDYELLLEWIRQGMPFGGADAPQLVGLRVSPGERELAAKSEQQLVATAVFSDGSLRDVTAAAGYLSNAGLVAEVSRGGLIHTGTVPGEAAVTVHYMGQVAVVRIQVPRPGGPEPYPDVPVFNRVDELALAKWKKLGIVPSALADDATFLRRLYLDAIGTLPTPDEVRAFLADPSPDKRKKAVEAVLARPEYADYRALQWADVLLLDRDKLGDRGAYEFHRWLREQFAHNRPYDRWVRELVTASGPSGRNGPVNFYRAVKTPEEATKALSQAFLGLRMECAQCHHHPFEKWSQDDFYGLAGFFNGLQRSPEGGANTMVWHAGYRATVVPLSNKPVSMHAPGAAATVPPGGDDPRRQLAAWMTRPENPWFARLVANRLWKHYLGRGLVEPEDDLRSTNPATNEPLLDFLTRAVVDSHFDLKAVERLILQSRVYQLSSVPNETNRDDEQNFSHYHVKRLPAEVLLDAISSVTGVAEEFPGRPRGTRAIELWDNRLPSYFLDVFGRSERASPCECGRSGEPTMTQVLHLMNAPEVEAKITSPGGRVARLLREKSANERVVEELCLAALGRPPGEKERRAAEKLFAAAPPEQAAQDFLWSLLNAYDFLFVH
jgi:hypothetical protein